jgi:hypothetical protein
VYEETRKVVDKLGLSYVGLLPSPFKSGIFKLVLNSSPKAIDFSDRVGQTTLRSGQHHDTLPNGNDGQEETRAALAGWHADSCYSLSWSFSPDDANINLMSLFHVGGIVR